LGFIPIISTTCSGLSPFLKRLAETLQRIPSNLWGNKNATARTFPAGGTITPKGLIFGFIAIVIMIILVYLLTVYFEKYAERKEKEIEEELRELEDGGDVF
ncbi:hypothetical protein, partial [Thermococcus sp.]|uniref:hypothetical protein n=1 Tax=Thermococcus sp. TaxID=35749 RepID=UPI0025E429B2